MLSPDRHYKQYILTCNRTQAAPPPPPAHPDSTHTRASDHCIPTCVRAQGAPLHSPISSVSPSSRPSPVSPLGRSTEAAVVITRSREWVTGGVCEPQSLHQWARLPPCRPSTAFPWPPLVICKRLSVGSAESAYKWIITNVSNVYCGWPERDLWSAERERCMTFV